MRRAFVGRPINANAGRNREGSRVIQSVVLSRCEEGLRGFQADKKLPASPPDWPAKQLLLDSKTKEATVDAEFLRILRLRSLQNHSFTEDVAMKERTRLD
jgi:hypothetical protein